MEIWSYLALLQWVKVLDNHNYKTLAHHHSVNLSKNLICQARSLERWQKNQVTHINHRNTIGKKAILPLVRSTGLECHVSLMTNEFYSLKLFFSIYLSKILHFPHDINVGYLLDIGRLWTYYTFWFGNCTSYSLNSIVNPAGWFFIGCFRSAVLSYERSGLFLAARIGEGRFRSIRVFILTLLGYKYV